MIDIDRVAEVKRSVLFHGLPPEEIQRIAGNAEVRHLKRGGVIFQQGRPAAELLLLVDGWVKVTHVTPKGDSIGLRFLQRGEHLACQAVFRDVPLPATATAASDCTFLVWKTPYIREILKRAPVVSQNALEIVGDRLNDFLGRIQELASEPVEVRLARHLVALVRDSGRKTDRGVGVEFPISRQDLAEMCSTTLFSVSRILNYWNELGLVEPSRQAIVVRDVHGLSKLIDKLPRSGSRA
jgi:CRP/FNR family transcriptional regulator, nitrogen oxide reductase regulator